METGPMPLSWAMLLANARDRECKMHDVVADVVADPGNMSLTSLESQQHKIGVRRGYVLSGFLVVFIY